MINQKQFNQVLKSEKVDPKNYDINEWESAKELRQSIQNEKEHSYRWI